MAKFTGFDVRCPGCGCGADDATLTIDLNNLKTITCTNCEWEGTTAEAAAWVAKQAAAWAAIARWVESAPGTTRGRMVTEEDE